MANEESNEQLEAIRKALLDLSKLVSTSFKLVDENFENIEKRINTLEDKIDALSTSAHEKLGDVGNQIADLKLEVVKIQKVSNYSEEYENLLRIAR